MAVGLGKLRFCRSSKHLLSLAQRTNCLKKLILTPACSVTFFDILLNSGANSKLRIYLWVETSLKTGRNLSLFNDIFSEFYILTILS